jgi:hypothetical protein
MNSDPEFMQRGFSMELPRPRIDAEGALEANCSF